MIGAQLIVSLGVIFIATIGVCGGPFGFGVPLPRQPWGFALVVVLSARRHGGARAADRRARADREIGLGGRAVLFFPLICTFAGLWTPQMSASAKHIGQFTPLGAATQALGDSMSGGWPHPAALAVLGV